MANQPLKKLQPIGKTQPKPIQAKQQLAKPTKQTAKTNGHDQSSPFSRKISAGDYPEPPAAEKINADGIIGQVTITETRDEELLMVTIPLNYPADSPESEFVARLFVRQEWLDTSFNAKEKLENEEIDEKTYNSYNMNWGRIQRLMKLAWGEEYSGKTFPDDLQGCVVGFTANPRKDDPSQLQLSSFFKPRIKTEEEE